MTSMQRKTTFLSVLATGGLIAIYWFAKQAELTLADSTVLTGYCSLVVMILLALFNTRKKLSMIPIFSARAWLMFHVIFGLAMIVLYLLHTGSLWPTGLYEQILASLFFLVCLTGIGGTVLSKIVPSRLRHLGVEIIFERIPEELYRIREAAKESIAEAVEKSGNITLSREYEESLAWFFAQPRFFFSHISGSGKPAAWTQSKSTSLQPFLSDDEKQRFEDVLDLMNYKNQIDAHYANQILLKGWLFLHLPLTVSLLVFVGWHVLLVHLYAL